MLLHLKKSWYTGESNKQLNVYYPLHVNEVLLIFFSLTIIIDAKIFQVQNTMHIIIFKYLNNI